MSEILLGKVFRSPAVCLQSRQCAAVLCWLLLTAAELTPQSLNPRLRRAFDQGPVESEMRLSYITLAFRRTPEQRAALERLLEQMQDPASPQYHRWLTPEQFGERFGASPEALSRVSDWLRSQGFTVESVARGRSFVVFSGTAAQVQNAFHAAIHRYQAGGRMHYAPSSAPVLPPEFKNIAAGIRGLDDFYFEPPRRALPLYTAQDGTHALAPADVARIYNFFQNAGGAGIAVVGQSSINLSDIRQFQSTFQLPGHDPQTLLVGVDPGQDPNGGLLEASADVEWAGALAPNAPILYVYAKNVLDATQQAIDQNLAPILTFSYGICEPNLSSADAAALRDLAQQANAQGITWIASSGDGGAAACDQGSSTATQGLAVSVPASLPEVTGVGGTEFNENPGAWGGNSPNLSSVSGYLPEIAWNDTTAASGLRASGGGASAFYPKPSWQNVAGVPDDGARDVPDVALSASPTHDPYLVISGGKTYAAGGTSLSAPLFAGMVALAEQPVNGTGAAPSGFGNINPWLYSLANPASPVPVYHDILAGNNVVPCAAGTPDCANGQLGYSAGPGYDLVTGLGSIIGFYFGLQIPTTTTLSVSSTQVAEGAPVTFSATVHDYNGRVPSGYVQFVNGKTPLSNGGVTYSLDATGTATATLSLPRGTYSVIAGFSATCCRFASSTSTPVPLVVAPAPPQPPPLVSPANGATGVSISILLNWNKIAFATSYDVYIGTTPSPPFWGNVTGNQTGTNIATCLPAELLSNTTYYWKIAARNDAGATASAVWSFTTTSTLYMISTIAGSSASGFSPDGTAASKAVLSGPTDVALDPLGNLYVAEAGNGRIRMINTAGVLSTVAGGGSGGDGPAIAAQLYPYGIAFDRQGNLYISEQLTPNGVSSIRKVTPAGIITTIAGGVAAGYSGDGGPALNAALHGPTALAVDSQGTLYIADTGNGCVRTIAAGIISTFAGQCGTNSFTSGVTVGDGGPATSAHLLFPSGVAVDTSGNVYIADSGNCRIRKVSNGIITSVIGLADGLPTCNGPVAPPFRPVRLTLDPLGNLYFVDAVVGYNNNIVVGRIVQFANGVATVIAGDGPITPGDGGPATSAGLLGPSGLALAPGGKVYFTENYSNNLSYPPVYSQRVRALAPSSSYPPPVPSISGGVKNGASFVTGPVAPGSIVSVFGNLSYGTPALAAGAPLPTALAGLSIQFQSGAAINAPLFYASPTQVNMQVPWELAGQSSVSVRPMLNGSAGSSQTVPVALYAPGIFIAFSGTTIGTIVDSNYVLVQVTNPVSAGSLLQIFCTGLGPVTNQPPSGVAASLTTPSVTTTKPTVTIGGVPATVLFSGLAPGAIGEYQVNALMPAGVTPGYTVPLVLSIGGVSANTVVIAVR